MFPTLYTRFDECSQARCIVSPTFSDSEQYDMPDENYFNQRKYTFPNHKCDRFLNWFGGLKDQLAPDMYLPNSVYRNRMVPEHVKEDGDHQQDGHQPGSKRWVPWWSKRMRNNKRHSQYKYEQYDVDLSGTDWQVATYDDDYEEIDDRGDDDNLNNNDQDAIDPEKKQEEIGFTGRQENFISADVIRIPSAAPTPLILDRPCSNRLRSSLSPTPKAGVAVTFYERTGNKNKIGKKTRGSFNLKDQPDQGDSMTGKLPVLKKGSSTTGKNGSGDGAIADNSQEKKTMSFPARLYMAKKKSYQNFGRYSKIQPPNDSNLGSSDKIGAEGQDKQPSSNYQNGDDDDDDALEGNIDEALETASSIYDEKRMLARDDVSAVLATSEADRSSPTSRVTLVLEEQIREIDDETNGRTSRISVVERKLSAVFGGRSAAFPQVVMASSITQYAPYDEQQQQKVPPKESEAEQEVSKSDHEKKKNHKQKRHHQEAAAKIDMTLQQAQPQQHQKDDQKDRLSQQHHQKKAGPDQQHQLQKSSPEHLNSQQIKHRQQPAIVEPREQKQQPQQPQQQQSNNEKAAPQQKPAFARSAATTLAFLPRDYRKFAKMSRSKTSDALLQSKSTTSVPKAPPVVRKPTEAFSSSNNITAQGDVTTSNNSLDMIDKGGKIPFLSSFLEDAEEIGYVSSRRSGSASTRSVPDYVAVGQTRNNFDIDTISRGATTDSGISSEVGSQVAIHNSNFTSSMESLTASSNSFNLNVADLQHFSRKLPSIVDEERASTTPTPQVDNRRLGTAASGFESSLGNTEQPIMQDDAIAFGAIVERSRSKQTRFTLPRVNHGTTACALYTHSFHDLSVQPTAASQSAPAKSYRYSSITEQLLRHYKTVEERRLLLENEQSYDVTTR